MGSSPGDVDAKLDKRHAEVVASLRSEWDSLMKYPPSESRTTAANHLLDRANGLGIGRLD